MNIILSTLCISIQESNKSTTLENSASTLSSRNPIMILDLIANCKCLEFRIDKSTISTDGIPCFSSIGQMGESIGFDPEQFQNLDAYKTLPA